jgi:hypothetical protein
MIASQHPAESLYTADLRRIEKLIRDAERLSKIGLDLFRGPDAQLLTQQAMDAKLDDALYIAQRYTTRPLFDRLNGNEVAYLLELCQCGFEYYPDPTSEKHIAWQRIRGLCYLRKTRLENKPNVTSFAQAKIRFKMKRNMTKWTSL